MAAATLLKRQADANEARQLTPLLTERQAADYLGVRPQTLALWRMTLRHDLGFIRVGTSIRYRARDLEQWLEQRTVKPAPVTA